MQEGADDTVAEIHQFGHRRHGEVRDGVLTQPSGSTVAGVQAGESNTLLSGVAPPWQAVEFDTAADVYLKNYAIVSWPASDFTPYMYGKSLPARGLPFVAPSGRVWFVYHDASQFFDCDDAQWQFDAQRFGLIGEGASADQHSITFANPVAGNPDFANMVAELNDASPDGSRRVYRITQSGTLPAGWIEITITEPGATQLGVSAALVRTKAQTLGAYTESPPTLTPASTATNWRGTVQWSGGGGTATGHYYEYGPYGEATVDNGTWVWDGSIPFAFTHTENLTVTGRIVSMHYTAAGTLDETLLDVVMDVVEDMPKPTITASSGDSQRVDWTVVPAGVNGSGQPLYITTGPDFSASISMSHTATSVATLTHTLRNASGSITQSNSVEIVRTEQQTSSILIQADSTPSTSNPNKTYLSTETRSGSHTQTYRLHGQADIVFTHPISVSSSTSTLTVVDVGLGLSSAAGNVGVPSLPGGLWGQFQTADTRREWVCSQIVLSGISLVPAQSGADRLRRVVQPFLRSNTLTALASADIAANNTVTGAWDGGMTGRNGAADPTLHAVSAVWANSLAGWALPSVSEQPATGAVLRGADEFEQVGYL